MLTRRNSEAQARARHLYAEGKVHQRGTCTMSISRDAAQVWRQEIDQRTSKRAKHNIQRPPLLESKPVEHRYTFSSCRYRKASLNTVSAYPTRA